MSIGSWTRVVGGLLAGATLVSACASMSGDPTLQAWRKVNQGEKRYAVFISEPGTREDDRVTFRMRFVYMPGEVKHDGAEVAWQEYHAMTVDCARNTVRLGPRTRYAPSGEAIVSDDDQTFSEILYGTAADDAAKAKCKGVLWVNDVMIPESPSWMDEAREHIRTSTPPKRP